MKTKDGYKCDSDGYTGHTGDINPKKRQTNEGRLLAFMVGWKRGASGLAFKDEEMKHPDFKSGYESGRRTAQVTYERSAKYFGAELSPLRAEMKAHLGLE